MLTSHVTKKGAPKLVKECSFPLTAAAVVARIITDLAVIDVTPEGFRLVELAPDVSEDEVRAGMDAQLLG